MPADDNKCGFCNGADDPIATLCETCIKLKIIGVCIDCQQPYEILDIRNPMEVRCVPCQSEFRKKESDDKHAWERYKAQLRQGS